MCVDVGHEFATATVIADPSVAVHTRFSLSSVYYCRVPSCQR
jgi:hypothetical protein